MAKKNGNGYLESLQRKLINSYSEVFDRFGIRNNVFLEKTEISIIPTSNVYTYNIKGTYFYRSPENSDQIKELPFLAKYFIPRDKDRPGFFYSAREQPSMLELWNYHFLKGLSHFLPPVKGIKELGSVRIFPYLGSTTLEKKLEGKDKEQKEDIILDLITEIRKFHAEAKERLEDYTARRLRFPRYIRRGDAITSEGSLDYIRALFGFDSVEELPARIRDNWHRVYSPISECFKNEFGIAHGDMNMTNVLYGTDGYEGKIFFIGPKLRLIDGLFDIDNLLASHGLNFNLEDRERILEEILTKEEREFLPKVLSISHRRVISGALRKLGKNADIQRLYPETWKNWIERRPLFRNCNNNYRGIIEQNLVGLARNYKDYDLSSKKSEELYELRELLDEYAILVPRDIDIPYANIKGIQSSNTSEDSKERI